MSDGLERRIGTVLNGIASGLIPMAIFTPLYAVWPLVAWPVPGGVFTVLALAWSGALAVRARRLLRLGRELPHETNAYDARIAKGMGILGGVQGGLILTSVVVLLVVGRWQWILPVVVLVVALHFFPMPWLFGRTIDYYLGSAMLLVAAIGLWLTARGDVAWQITWTVVGGGAALVTSAYGLWMCLTARRVLGEYRALGAER